MRRYTLFNKYIPCFTALVLVLTMLCAEIPAVSAAETEGSCGENLTWTFVDGTLTITGSGAMTDYARLENIPWYGFRDQILRISLPEGLIKVGSMAFYDCYKLTAVIIPSTVREIGELAFCQCTEMTILQLNDGLQTIGRSAFERCESLQDLRLPGTVTELGRHAFYFCKSLRYVTVPESVTVMGDGVFAYCEKMVRAEINAPLETLPHWTFYGCLSLSSISLTSSTKNMGGYAVYGCENLGVVYYGGEAGDVETLREQISEDKADFGRFGFIVDEDSGNTEMSSQIKTDESGDTIVEDTTVTQTDDATVTVTTSTNISTGDEAPGTDITATVIGNEGWSDVVDAVEGKTETGDVNVTVFIPGEAEVPQTVIDTLAGKNVTMNVQTGSGSSYVLDFRVIEKKTEAEAEIEAEEPLRLDLSYLLFRLDSENYPELQANQVFRLVFNSSSEVPAEVMIQLPVEISNKNATLYQPGEEEGLTALQSVVTDNRAVAHFYLGAVDNGTEYLIGINVPGIGSEDLIIPDNMKAEYGITDQFQKVEYVVTGRTSSWGMSMGQVGGILAGVMGVCVVGIGLTMYILNKRKLRRGYVVDLYDEEK